MLSSRHYTGMQGELRSLPRTRNLAGQPCQAPVTNLFEVLVNFKWNQTSIGSPQQLVFPKRGRSRLSALLDGPTPDGLVGRSWYQNPAFIAVVEKAVGSLTNQRLLDPE